MKFDIDKYYLEQQKRMEADQDSDDAEAYVTAFKRVRAATNFVSSQVPSESTSIAPLAHDHESEPINEMPLSKRKQPEEPLGCGPEYKKKCSSLHAPPSGSASATISEGTLELPKLVPNLPPVQPHIDNSIANISRDTICEFDDTLSSPNLVPDQPPRNSKVQESKTKQQRHVSPSRPNQGVAKITPQNARAKDKAQDSNTNNQAPRPLVFHETESVVTKFPRIDLAAVASHSDAKKASSSLKAQAHPLQQASNAKKRVHTEDLLDVAAAGSNKVKLDAFDMKGKKTASSKAVPGAPAAAATSTSTSNVLFPSVDRKPKGRSKTPAADTPNTNATTSTSSRSLQKQSTTLAGGKSKSTLSLRNANGAKSTLPSMSPEEFARKLLADPPKPGPSDCQCLEGKVFLIVGGERQFVSERTRGQMKYILKHGGTFTPTYDPELITHIITEAGEEKTRRTLGIRNIKEIPDHIPTVKWNYVLSCRPGTSLSKMEFMHASFASRLEAGHDWKAENGKGRLKKKSNEDVGNRLNNASANTSDAVGAAGATTRKSDEDGEVSRIEEFTPERPKRHVGSAAATAAMPPPPLGAAAAAPLSSLEARTIADDTILDASFSRHILTPPSSPIVALSSNKRALPSSAPTTPEKNSKKRRKEDGDANENKNENVGAEKEKKRGGHGRDPLAEFYAQARAEKDADSQSEYDDKEAVPGEEDRTSDLVEEEDAALSRSASIQGGDDDSETDTDQDDDNDKNNSRDNRVGVKKLWVPAKRVSWRRAATSGTPMHRAFPTVYSSSLTFITPLSDLSSIARTACAQGFTCDNPQLQRTDGTCPNQDVIDKLSELRDLHKAKPTEEDQWRTFSYDKCIRALKSYPYRIQSLSEARSIRGIGKKTAIKVMEIIRTGNLARIDHERTEDVEVTKIFQGIYGVGRKISYQWYMTGLRTLDDVRARKGGLVLSPAQEIGLEFYDDLQKRIPRREARTIYECIKAIALKMDSQLFIEIMGSYRRGKADCGDIDILISRPPLDGKTHKGILRKLLPALHEANIVTEDLHVPHNYEDLENVYRGLCVLPSSSSANSSRLGKETERPVAGIRRRIDILAVPWENRGAALLYYTGDDIFNRAMRLKASVMGYSLNQRGLYQGVVRDPRSRMNKLCKGTRIAGETEEEVFEILGIPWQEPHERVRGH